MSAETLAKRFANPEKYYQSIEDAKSDMKKASEYLKKFFPMEVTDIHVDEYYCPSCGSEICFSNEFTSTPMCDEFCPECGQKLFVDEDRWNDGCEK